MSAPAGAYYLPAEPGAGLRRISGVFSLLTYLLSPFNQDCGVATLPTRRTIVVGTLRDNAQVLFLRTGYWVYLYDRDVILRGYRNNNNNVGFL